MFTRIRAIHFGLVLAAATILITAGIISAQQPSQEESVRGTANHLLMSINNENFAAVISSLDSTATIDGFGFCPGDECVDLDAIRTALEVAAQEDLRLRIVPGTERVHGQVWISEVDLRAASITNGGSERLIYQLEIEIKGEKVMRLRFTPELDDPPTAAFLGTDSPASVGPRPVQPPSTGSGGLLVQ